MRKLYIMLRENVSASRRQKELVERSNEFRRLHVQAFGLRVLKKYLTQMKEIRNDKILSKFLEKEDFFQVQICHGSQQKFKT